MRKLTADELGTLRTKRGKASWLRVEIDSLQKSEGLHIERSDYKHRSGPYPVIRRLMKKSSKKFRWARMADGNGWVVERLE